MKMHAKRFLALIVSLLFFATCLQTASYAVPRDNKSPAAPAMQPPPPASPELDTVQFPVNSYVIPMDEKQTNVTQAFGLAHAMLRNGSWIYRIIQPPDVTIKTTAYAMGTPYRGGPILIMNSSESIINAVKPTFPNAALHKVTETFSSDKVFTVKTPTKIILTPGSVPCGYTDKLLREMKIPYKNCTWQHMRGYPHEVDNYSLYIDDCVGMNWSLTHNGFQWTPGMTSAWQNFTARGNEIIFTCWSLDDIKLTFPGYVRGGITSYEMTRSTTITPLPEFPAQYYGTTGLMLHHIWSEAEVVNSSVRVFAQGVSPTWTDALYFNYGRGIAEFFSFHPGEQTGDANRASIILYGNKFLHVTVDQGVVNQNDASPKTIATNGTSDPASETTTIMLTLKPVGFAIMPSNNMTVNYRLRPYIDNVSGTFVDLNGIPLPPDSLTVNPDSSKSLQWKIDNLPEGKSWYAYFNITSRKAGTNLPVNDWNASNVTYFDFGKTRVRTFMEVKINVIDGYAAPEIVLPVVTVGILSALFITLLRRRRKKY